MRGVRDAALADLARDAADDGAAEPLRPSVRLLHGAMTALADVLDARHPAMTGAGVPRCPACESVAPCPTVHRVADTFASAGVRGSAPLDRAGAWARADSHFNGSSSGRPRVLVSLADLGAFYLARGVRVTLPEPPRVPVPDTEPVLLIDKAHGRMSRWPLLPDADLIVQHRRYLRGEPMILGEQSTAERTARP